MSDDFRLNIHRTRVHDMVMVDSLTGDVVDVPINGEGNNARSIGGMLNEQALVFEYFEDLSDKFLPTGGDPIELKLLH